MAMVLKCLAFLSAMMMSTGVIAEERIALLIGNSAYKSIVPLDNAGSDAVLMERALAEAGFQTTLVMDGSQSDMKRAIADFGRQLRSAGPETTGLFFYAGHGVQSQGTNYLLPVDSAIRDEVDLDLVAVEANWVVRQMDSARIKNSIIVLDACRNNPFEQLSDVIRDGLAEMNAPTGSFISYSTAPGAVSYDGVGENSPFTESLAALIPTGGLPIEALFKQVRVEVLEKTDGAQTPWESSSLTSDFAFVEGVQETPEEFEARSVWESVQGTDDSVQVILFMRAFPNSKYIPEARALLERLVVGETQTATATPTPAPATAPARQTEPEMDMVAIQAAYAKAQSGATVAAFEAFLAEYPDTPFTEAAQAELAFLSEMSKQAAAPAPEPEPAPEAVADEVAEPFDFASAPIFYTQPLPGNDPNVSGRSLEQLIAATPLFSPIEGLDEAAWAGQQCSNCHAWTQEALCDQGKFYLSAKAERALGKQHPLGGGFKAAIRHWADGGCR